MFKQSFGRLKIHDEPSSFFYEIYIDFNCHFYFMFTVIFIFSAFKFINFPKAIP